MVDAHVATLAASGDVVLTGDPVDLRQLLLTREVDAEVRRV